MTNTCNHSDSSGLSNPKIHWFKIKMPSSCMQKTLHFSRPTIPSIANAPIQPLKKEVKVAKDNTHCLFCLEISPKKCFYPQTVRPLNAVWRLLSSSLRKWLILRSWVSAQQTFIRFQFQLLSFGIARNQRVCCSDACLKEKLVISNNETLDLDIRSNIHI